MRLNVSAWSIRKPIPSIVLFAVLFLLGVVSFRTMSITRFPNIDIPIVQVLITQSGAAPSELEVAGHQDGRGFGRRPERRLAHHFPGHRRLVLDDRSVQRRLGRHRPRAERRQGPDRQDQERPAAFDRRTDHQPHRRRGSADRHLRGLGARNDGRAIVLVHRRRRLARVAEREGGRRGQAHRRRRSRNPGFARSGEAARARRHRGDGQRSGPRGQCRHRRRARRGRGPGTGDPHARRRALGRRSGGPADRAAGRPQGQARRTGNGDGRSGGAAHFRAIVRRADRRLLGRPRQGGERRDRRSSRRGEARAHPSRASRGDLHQGRHASRQRTRQLSLDDGNPDRGRAARGRRRARLPARFSRHRRHRHRTAAFDHPDLLGDGRDRLLAQSRQPARDHARHRHSRRRCDRRDRKHRAPHADGQVGVSRLAGGRRRDRPRGDRDLAVDRRDLRSGQLHGRHRRPIFSPVRPDGRDRRAVLAAGRALRHAGRRRLFPARAPWPGTS